MKKLLILGGIGFGLVGCVSPSYNAIPAIKNISKPPIGSINTANVGEHMLEQGVIRETDVLVVDGNTKVGSYTIPAGRYSKTGDNEKGMYFNPITTSSVMVLKPFYADPLRVIMTTLNGDLCVVTVFNVKSCEANKNFTVKKVTAMGENSFQQTLIYSGKVGNKINISYREFSGNLARPAFNNDVEYDLNQSKQIGYKGALLEVLDANNQSITYKILKNFNKTED